MESLMISINVVFPICFIVMVGYLVQRLNLVPKTAFDGCVKACFQILIPIRLFMSLSTSEVSNAFNPTLVAVVLASEIGFWLLSMLIIPKIQKDPRKRGAMVQGLFRGNYVLFGIPIAEMIVGPEIVGAAAIVMVLVVPLYTTLAVVALEYFRSGKPDLKRILLSVLKNPLIISSILGIIWMLTGWQLPDLLRKPLNDLAGIGTPLSLFALGGTFRFASVRSNLKPLVQTTVGKLVLLPMLMMGLGLLCGLRGPLMAILLGVAATSVSASSFPLVESMGGDGEFAGQIVVMTTLFCFPTMFLWVFLLSSLGMF